MIRSRFTRPIFALIAAYALALHMLAAGMVPMAHLPGDATWANAILCTGASGTGQPAGQDQDDHSACVLHCIFAGGVMDSWAPAISSIVAIFAPTDIRVPVLLPIETPGRAAAKNPQIPRAPPLA